MTGTSIEPIKDTLSVPDVLNTSHKLAVQICSTDFVPARFKGKPEACMAAMLFGREIGLGPMTALSHIHVIEGTPALDAQTQWAMVLGAGHEMWVEESTPQTATVAGVRRSTEQVQRVTWTMADAQRAGLADRNPNYKKYPRQQLLARAKAELARLVGGDVLGGVPYTVEELQDDSPAPRRAIRAPVVEPAQEPAAPPAATIRRARQPATVEPAPKQDLPAFDDDEPVEAEIVDEQPPAKPARRMTEAQAFAANLPGDLSDDDRHALYWLATNNPDARHGDLAPKQRTQVVKWAKAIEDQALTLNRYEHGVAIENADDDIVASVERADS